MARRLGEPAALAAALMSMHATLQHIAYAAERSRLAEEAVALAGELDDDELAALAGTGSSTTSSSSAPSGGAAPTRSSRPWPTSSVSRSTATPRWPGAACGLGSPGGSTRPSDSPTRRSARRARRRSGRPGHFTAQLLAVRREQGRMPELLVRSPTTATTTVRWPCMARHARPRSCRRGR